MDIEKLNNSKLAMDTALKYSDIINLEHHISKKHAQMDMSARAAQFAPFAAMTGLSDEIIETGRLTDGKIELDEDERAILDNKLKYLIANIGKPIEATYTYFIKDEKKEGGRYISTSGIIKKIDEIGKRIMLDSDDFIAVEDIIFIEMKEKLEV